VNLPIEIQRARRRGIFHRPLTSVLIRSYSFLFVLTRLHSFLVTLVGSQFALIRSYMLIHASNDLKAFWRYLSFFTSC